MFSIIIPLYNKAPYIEKAIRSVAAQSFQDFELIVMDDGSTDDSLANAQHILANLTPPLGGWGIVEQENQGVSATRNNGVKLARYDYIAFLDADDWWEPTYLEEMKGLIKRHADAGIYGSSYYKVKDHKNTPANIGVNRDFMEGYINYCRVYSKTFYMPLWTGATIVRKSIYREENGFKPDLILGEDFDLWIRIALKYPVAFLNKCLAYYNQDVTIEHKAVIKRKIYEPKSIYIFNLEYLKEEEERNPDLKYLLDLLRVYTFERYRIQGAYKELVRKEIDKVDFSRQRTWYWVLYHVPVWTIKTYYFTRQLIKYLIHKFK